MLILIDNYDSFVYNIYQYIGEITEDIKVFRNDKITIQQIIDSSPQGIIISPGPKRPEDAGISIELIKKLSGIVPILGICLGHQAIGCAFNSKVIKAPHIMHGKTSIIKHSCNKLFNGVKNPLKVMRYHSLIIERNSLSHELEIEAQTEDGVIMSVKHKNHETYGLQFHPESVFTQDGKIIIKNFVEGICNVK